MKHLIDKDKIVAEIERKIKTYKECIPDLKNLEYYQGGKIDALYDIISFINALEVKEVDLDNDLIKEVYSYLNDIKETADRVTSGNFMHHMAAIKCAANTITKVLELIGFNAQKGK